MPKLPKVGSAGEEEFALHCSIYKIHVEREYPVCLDRKWRFDFFIPNAHVAVEIEGGTWSNGRHSRGGGMASDMDKYNRAALAGIRVFRFTPEMVHSGTAIDMIREVLK